MKITSTGTRHVGTILAFLGLLLASAGVSMAQDATPGAGSHAAHPAHIHAGTCADLGDVVYPLTGIGGGAATPDAMGMMGHDMGTPMAGGHMMDGEASVTDVESSLDDLLAGEHAINVHESMENIGNYIACGDLAGTPEDGELTVEIAELNGSGYSGEAVLVDNGDGTTTVTVTLTGSEAGAATPAAGSGDVSEGDVHVAISGFAYDPDPVTIKVGQSVTWTNEDSSPHTATARDRDVLQSGTLDQGESYTQVFDTAGTYEYFCEFHPNMKGTVIVEE